MSLDSRFRLNQVTCDHAARFLVLFGSERMTCYKVGRASNKSQKRNELAVNRENISRAPVHPGVFVERNILPEFLHQRLTIGDIAKLLGVSRQTLHRVMTGQSSITPDMAVRLGKLCGNGPGLWLNLQARYGGWEATQRLGEQLKNIPPSKVDKSHSFGWPTYVASDSRTVALLFGCGTCAGHSSLARLLASVRSRGNVQCRKISFSR